VSYSPDCPENGRACGIVAMVQDITAHKQMEEALRQSKERLQHVFSQAPVAIVVLSGLDFVVELANPAYEALLQGRELCGRRLQDVIPDAGEHVWAALKGVMESGEPFVANDFFVPYDQDGDGIVEDHWFNLVYHPLSEPDGPVSGIVAVANEVTTQVVARKELERVNRELEEFAYVASHDLQEPLRMVNIYTQLLLKDFVGQEPKALKYADLVQQGVTRMQTLIRDLLTYSRSVQRDELPIGVADLSAALSDALDVLKSRIEENAAVIIAEPLPMVRGDTKQMTHVFQNLLSNSLKYRREDVAPRIQISATHGAGHCTICVADNGIGFEPQYAERIFGLFKRLHKEQYPGTGLGLAICQRIVERYGGRMWAEGDSQKGAIFYFSLPCPEV
jgi:PAS domain S-box-containing protein